MMGSNGSIAADARKCDCSSEKMHCPLSLAETVVYDDQAYHVVPYGVTYDSDGTRISMRVDMNARECSFEVNGIPLGVAFWDLPAQVYPAISTRNGGRIRLITCMDDSVGEQIAK